MKRQRKVKQNTIITYAVCFL